MAWRVLVPGAGRGEVLVLDEPLSFWGGLDVTSGAIVDVHHPQRGEIISGRVLVMPFARGSSSTANALAEAIHRGTGPAAIVLGRADEIVVLGAVIPGELYGEWCPVVVAGSGEAPPTTGELVAVDAQGVHRLEEPF